MLYLFFMDIVGMRPRENTPKFWYRQSALPSYYELGGPSFGPARGAVRGLEPHVHKLALVSMEWKWHLVSSLGFSYIGFYVNERSNFWSWLGKPVPTSTIPLYVIYYMLCCVCYMLYVILYVICVIYVISAINWYRWKQFFKRLKNKSILSFIIIFSLVFGLWVCNR